MLVYSDSLGKRLSPQYTYSLKETSEDSFFSTAGDQAFGILKGYHVFSYKYIGSIFTHLM